MNDPTIWKWAAGLAGSGLLAMTSYLGGQLSMTQEIQAIRAELRNPNPVVQAQLDGIQRQLDDIKELLRDTP